MRSVVRLSFFVLVLLVGACGGDDADPPSTSGASSGGIEVLGPDADVNGMSTADLLGTYVVGVVETPADDSSMVDPAKCDMGLSTGSVYFAPTPGEPGDLSTTCTMSADQTLMVMPTSAFCIDAPEAGGTADTACLDRQWDLTGSSLTVDGVEVEGLDAYEVDSEVIDVTLPERNLFEEPRGAGRAEPHHRSWPGRPRTGAHAWEPHRRAGVQPRRRRVRRFVDDRPHRRVVPTEPRYCGSMVKRSLLVRERPGRVRRGHLRDEVPVGEDDEVGRAGPRRRRVMR